MPLYASIPTGYSQLASRLTTTAPVSAGYLASIVGPQSVQTADASISGRTAMGVLNGNILSGLLVDVITAGAVSNAVWSGTFVSGAPVFLGSGGLPVGTPPSTSGNVVQRVGVADSFGGFIVQPSQDFIRIGQ